MVEILNTKKDHIVFILWGDTAQKKAQKVDQKKHLVLKSVHPSPLSYYRGFLGSRPFSQANFYLKNHGIGVIDWDVDTHLD